VTSDPASLDRTTIVEFLSSISEGAHAESIWVSNSTAVSW
jgi:hypothetical protein